MFYYNFVGLDFYSYVFNNIFESVNKCSSFENYLYLSNNSFLLFPSTLNKIEKIYKDPLHQRKLKHKENIEKIGVYAWYNNINGKFYIGSGDPLYLRISDYYQKWYMESRSNLYIIRALSKYGIGNFTLYILEYTNGDQLIECEQKWIDLLKPEYNLNPNAGNSKGYIHTLESIEKMKNLAKGRKHSKEVKEAMSLNRRGENNSFFNKKHSLDTLSLIRTAALNRKKASKPGIEVEIKDIETNSITVFSSIRKAAISINSDIKTILRREKLESDKRIKTPYKGKYIIIIKKVKVDRD